MCGMLTCPRARTWAQSWCTWFAKFFFWLLRVWVVMVCVFFATRLVLGLSITNWTWSCQLLVLAHSLHFTRSSCQALGSLEEPCNWFAAREKRI